MDRTLGPRLKVERAKEHIVQLHAAIEKFVASDPYTHFTEDDPETGDLIYRVTVEPHANEGLGDLAVIAGDAVHNLRSALDLLMWQLVDASGGKPGRHTTFPIARSEKKFVSGSARCIKGASPAVQQLVAELKPYKGGHDALWRLHSLDATDKHRLLLTVGATHTETVYRFTLFGVEMGPYHVAMNDPAVLLEDRAEIGRIPASARDYFEQQPKPEFTVYVALREPEIPRGDALLPALYQLTGAVTEIIDLFAPFLAARDAPV